MFYKLRDHIPCDYAAMHEGQNVYNDQGEFHDSFQYQPPPAPVLPSTFPGTQMNSSAPKEDVAALINRRNKLHVSEPRMKHLNGRQKQLA